MELIIKDVKKRYGNVIALSDVSLSVQSGECRALVGGNGSGKSTLAKILGGVVALDSGEITLDGKPYKVNSPIEAKHQGIIITSQELSLLPNLNIVQNICLCGMNTKKGMPFLDVKKMEERTRGVLRMVGKEHLINRRIDTLLPNERYLLELAKALVQPAKVVILDEITSALYKNDVEQVKKIIIELKNKGVIVLFISHRLNEVFSMCDSISVLRNGLSVGTFDQRDLSENVLISHMSGRDIEDCKEAMRPAHVLGDTEEVALETGNIHLETFDKEVSLTVRRGEFIGVAGLDGQGQTAFLRKLFGLHRTVYPKINGKQVAISSPVSAIKNGIAYVTGDRDREGVFKERSIDENVTTVQKLVIREKAINADKILKENGVKYHLSKDLITSLSGGNQQKVIIARWTSTRPGIILADDPTKGIDVQSRRDVHMTFQKLLDQGTSVIMISSDDEELVEASKLMPLSRIIVMYEGEIVCTLCGEDITLENIAAWSVGKSNTEVVS